VDSSAPAVVALSIGRARTLDGDGTSGFAGTPWTTGIFKAPVHALVLLSPQGFDGDEQVDLVNHGGHDKAACAYSADHYPSWRDELKIEGFDYGAFGENLTVTGIDEGSVCIGDTWAIGDAVVQVSQPRQPCWKLGRKWGLPHLPDQVVKAGRTGWYFRVTWPGPVGPGSELTLLERPHPAWTIAAANNVMHQRQGDVAALAAVPELAASWRHTLERRLRPQHGG
jgi:MOSC domain-containing protein YiiM